MASLFYITVSDLFSKYLKENKDIDISQYEIIVVSKDIVADRQLKFGNTVTYESRYNNIGFAMELFPNPQTMEFYFGSTFESYRQQYIAQLATVKSVQAMCCIADMLVNDDLNIILVCSGAEYKMEFMSLLTEELYERFRVKMYSYDEYLTNPACINDIGDKEEIKKFLEFQLKEMELIDKEIGEFFNRFTDDMETKYREILMSKSIDQLIKYGMDKNVYVNKHKPKEVIVDHILKKVLSTI